MVNNLTEKHKKRKRKSKVWFGDAATQKPLPTSNLCLSVSVFMAYWAQFRCECGRAFDSEQGLSIHKGHNKCKRICAAANCRRKTLPFGDYCANHQPNADTSIMDMESMQSSGPSNEARMESKTWWTAQKVSQWVLTLPSPYCEQAPRLLVTNVTGEMMEYPEKFFQRDAVDERFMQILKMWRSLPYFLYKNTFNGSFSI